MRLSLFFLTTYFFIAPLRGYDFIRHTDNLNESRFFDTSFISNYPAVKKVLLEEEGFTEVFFSTPNNHILQGLFRRVEKPDFTIIFCSGFFPGKQEGIATFLTMMPKNCNILFFNSHGKGRSTGLFTLLNLVNYGRYDYLDTIGAIEYAHFMNNGPLFIHGVCSGAFHASHALIHLKETIHTYNIKGLVCDSSWPEIDVITVGIFNDKLAHVTSRIKKMSLHAGRLFAKYIAAPIIRRHAHETNLLHTIDQLTVPVFFIHSHDDTLTHIAPAQQLANNVKHKECWWINQKSKHGCHHLKHKYDYAEKLKNFICTQMH